MTCLESLPARGTLVTETSEVLSGFEAHPGASRAATVRAKTLAAMWLYFQRPVVQLCYALLPCQSPPYAWYPPTWFRTISKSSLSLIGSRIPSSRLRTRIPADGDIGRSSGKKVETQRACIGGLPAESATGKCLSSPSSVLEILELLEWLEFVRAEPLFYEPLRAKILGRSLPKEHAVAQ